MHASHANLVFTVGSDARVYCAGKDATSLICVQPCLFAEARHHMQPRLTVMFQAKRIPQTST